METPDMIRESTKKPPAFYYVHLVCFQEKHGAHYTSEVLAGTITERGSFTLTPMSSAALLGEASCVYCYRMIKKAAGRPCVSPD